MVSRSVDGGSNIVIRHNSIDPVGRVARRRRHLGDHPPGEAAQVPNVWIEDNYLDGTGAAAAVVRATCLATRYRACTSTEHHAQGRLRPVHVLRAVGTTVAVRPATPTRTRGRPSAPTTASAAVVGVARQPPASAPGLSHPSEQPRFQSTTGRRSAPEAIEQLSRCEQSEFVSGAQVAVTTGRAPTRCRPLM